MQSNGMKVKILFYHYGHSECPTPNLPDHITRVKVNATLASNQDPRGRCPFVYRALLLGAAVGGPVGVV
jgi:hypothetical protein